MVSLDFPSIACPPARTPPRWRKPKPDAAPLSRRATSLSRAASCRPRRSLRAPRRAARPPTPPSRAAAPQCPANGTPCASLRRRDAVGKRRKPSQPVRGPGRNLLHTLPVVRSAHNTNERRQQHLVQGIGHHPRNPVVRHRPAYDPKTQATWHGPPTPFNPTWLTRR